MDNIIEVQFNEMLQRTRSIWQYDYGQVLKILSGGVVLPNFLEVHFSLSRENEKCITRIGTTVNGVTEVQIPNELLNTENKTHDYFIYAFIYVSTEKYGNTKCEIIIPVKSRIKPENPSEEPLPEPNIFHETVEAVNAAADRAKMAEQDAKESAAEAGKYAASASESAVTAEKTKEDALRKVGEKKREAIEAIQNQEETSVGKITTHTDGEIQRIQNHAAESKGELEQTIINAGVSKEELDESIQTASDTKTALDKSVELAGTAKPELDTSIREAGTAKTALDESTETAGTVQETLSATVKQAGALDTSLGEKIKTGTQLKTDLVTSGEKAVQDIQAAGSEQLGKMQAVAEVFTADREQIAKNKADIGSLKEDLDGVNNYVTNNILVSQQCFYGKNVSTVTGNLYDEAEYCAVKIDVDSSTQYQFVSKNKVALKIAQYDEENNFIYGREASWIDYNDDVYSYFYNFTTTSTTKIIIFSIPLAEKNNIKMAKYKYSDYVKELSKETAILSDIVETKITKDESNTGYLHLKKLQRKCMFYDTFVRTDGNGVGDSTNYQWIDNYEDYAKIENNKLVVLANSNLIPLNFGKIENDSFLYEIGFDYGKEKAGISMFNKDYKNQIYITIWSYVKI